RTTDAHTVNPSIASLADRSTPLRILVVDDNEINQVVACKFLQKLGCQVEVARNGREAVDSIAHATYDAVLMDCEMPEMNAMKPHRRLGVRNIPPPAICPSLPSPGMRRRRTNRSADEPAWTTLSQSQ
ncbi:MAG TPA: response regulator, partial [Nitrospiraceae bacterium]|nr:response regulator [Nitrospiraceae bacterium]